MFIEEGMLIKAAPMTEMTTILSMADISGYAAHPEKAI